MCFSAEADVAAGVIVIAVGVDAVRHVSRRAEYPLATIPLLLGAHQLVEAFVWWGLEGDVGGRVERLAIWLYLIIAFGVLPILVPIAIGAIEPAASRRAMAGFTMLGVFVAGALMAAVVRGPVVAVIEQRHIDYQVDLWRGGVLVSLYVVATCGPLLISHRSHIRWFGIANVAVAIVLGWLSNSAFISLWCLWAAVTSVAIALHLRASHPRPVAELTPTG